MKIGLRSFSRLTIIFILAVTIPGGILTYLSIQNITHLKELTEKKVLEEEKELADLIYQNFQSNINETTEEFSDYVSKIDEHDYNSIRFSDTIDFIENPFIADQYGTFIWPNFNPGIPSNRNRRSSLQFIRNYAAAEKYEFAEQDYARAKTACLLALNSATVKSDSAQAMNALARLYVKGNNNGLALKYYTILISDFYAVTDKNGISYIHYALPQLINISDSSNVQLILNGINFVLSKIASGAIPLNYSSETIIENISDWIAASPSLSAYELNKTNLGLAKIKDQLSFYFSNSEVIKDYVVTHISQDTISSEEFTSLPGTSETSLESIMIKLGPTHNHISGFIINLENLIHHSLNIDIPPANKFKFKIEIINTRIRSIPRDEYLITISKISPLTPNHSLFIKLEDENSIKKEITRTSWIYGIAITLLLGGMILGVFLIIKDIHREKYLSQLRSEFVSNVTHELKTPLTSIYMFAESILLGRVKTKADQKEYLGIILKETDRLKRLINNILDFSKREKGKLVYHFTEVNISELIKSAIHDLDYWIMEKKFSVRTEIDENIYGHADPDALKQSIINLLSNAINYSRERKEIVVRLMEKDKLITIEVEDKGIGIPEDQFDSIFDKFYRVESENVTEISGTGLGLTVVKDIVKAHNGEILVKSKINEGSTFTIILKSLQ